MENQELNKAIAYLADKVSKYHERLLAAERDLERHLKDEKKHCDSNCDCKKPDIIKTLET
jgi:hypothetical protein